MAERNPVDVARSVAHVRRTIRTPYSQQQRKVAERKGSALVLGDFTMLATTLTSGILHATGNIALGGYTYDLAKAMAKATHNLALQKRRASAKAFAAEHFAGKGPGKQSSAGPTQTQVAAARVALGRQAASAARSEQGTPTVAHQVHASIHTPHSDRAALGTSSGNTKRGFQNPNNLKAALMAQGKRAPA